MNSPDVLERYREEDRKYKETSDRRYALAWAKLCQHDSATKKLQDLERK